MYRRGRVLPRWRWRLVPPDQVVNAFDSMVNLTPAVAPGEATRADWAALLPHQRVAMVGERVVSDGPFWDE